LVRKVATMGLTRSG